MVEPYRYGESVLSTAPPPAEAGFLRQSIGNFGLGATYQTAVDFGGWLIGGATYDPDYNPLADIKGYEPYADRLVHAQSREQMDWMKSQIDVNLREKQMMSGGVMGFAASITGSFVDPINLIPIPISRGLGFVRGAAMGAAANTAIAAVTEPLRIRSDPTADWNELAYSIGGAALFGGALGGIAGRALPLSRQDFIKGQGHFDRFVTDLSEIEGTNIARAFNAAEENYQVVSGSTGLFEDGRYEPVKIEVVETTLRQKKGSDGNLYHYDDTLGWVLEADRGRPDPRPVGQDMLDELGVPEKKLENRMVVDEAALKQDFEDGRTGLAEGEIRTPGEYVTFKQIESVWKLREPQKPGESRQQWLSRVRESALAELKGSRASASVARNSALAQLLDKANFSPVAKAIRLFRNDNVLGDLPLELAGDYGWAIRANEFGYKTPPSLLLRAMRHNVAFNEVRQAVDAAYVRFAQQNAKTEGRFIMGQNVTAAAEGLRARAKSLTGQKVITKEIFSKMAGRAVFDPSEFEIDGFRVVPEAREAAKAWTRVAQKYDAEARELGLFYDQRSLQRTSRIAGQKIADLKISMAEFLWGGKRAPSKLYPAVKVGNQLFFGDTHELAVKQAVDALGPDIQLSPDSYGYVDNLVTSNDTPVNIVKSAIRFKDGTQMREFEGANHFDAMMLAEEQTGLSMEEIVARGVEDGFITSEGNFVGRTEAERIAAAANQLGKRKSLTPEETLLRQQAVRDGRMAEGLIAEDLTQQAPGPASAQPNFRKLNDVLQGRIDSLSEAQRRVYDDWKDQLDQLQQAKSAADMQLQGMQEQPHTFRNQFGEPEPFFARFWNHTAIGMERERFKALLTAWYRKDNPAGAEQRADKTIDDMLKSGEADDERPAQVPGLRHLNQRKLDMPNSFKITDPQLGEISAAEFFNTDLEMVAEAYLRGMGHKIEAAKMFGDAGLWKKRQQIMQHFRDQYLVPALKKGADAKEIEKLLARRDEYLGWIDLIQRGVMGGLKTRDPWAIDNRIARNLKNYQVLTSMGKVLLTSIPEAMRIPMVNAFRTAFGGILDRALLDAKKLRANVEFSRLTGEIFDLVRDVHSARVAELNTPDPSGGGSYIERLLQRSIPGYFKLVGLTHWTVMAKDLVMFTAQHKVMDLAKRVDEGDNAATLAGLGISRRDAKLLASMPSEQHGRLILPAVQNWTGPDGARARTLLLDAIHAEARRAIVTPSFADKSLLFHGIWTTRDKVRRFGKGEDVKFFESDMMSVPLQFLSYGIAANQKVLMSALQGRDQSAVMGALALFMMGMVSNYLKQPQTATMNKSAMEWALEGYEASGVGAFWFSDLNQMIERYSSNTLGLRPTLGIDPRFGKTTNVGDYIDAAGPSLGTLWDVGATFWDSELTASNKAQAIRRAVPYNNVIYWGSVTRDIAGKAAQSFQ